MKKLSFSAKTAIFIFPLVGIMYGWWCAEPYYYINELDASHQEHTREAIEVNGARLVNLGPRAIDPIIDSLRGSSSFDWEAYDLMGILTKFGERAHQKLLVRIDNDKSVDDRIGLIYVLQTSFDDYSRVNLWIAYIQHTIHKDSTYLHRSLRNHWSNVPTITNDHGSITNDFVVWYKKTQASTGHLPAYDFYRTSNF